uniref:Vacuolar protein sorting-associated protein 28 homolog n=1 Tax=Tetraselmis chuii TaxID=63592 RepID=A0A7S1T3J6_9CHLO|mmetsp:Transcript_43746/g.78170  ORF Transcript_43746/g.78170 Transcript_43746/m.78170 type:complete len:209 (+) Transcript_43746:302-928(+)|eukprot:CAMPEP_0177750820 /NCGR_PEP_ID=MMETSP0491_2-20121128/43_1 /TAXON_ID=63592 /ORGANISM="Tetraselmis chuii, Strain PLY429" /LENGTH=208 /DNA_ID=CAMNT_0019265889 /DNA_START=267 /DNA_END=893 /DNA_ORIENTATION=+
MSEVKLWQNKRERENLDNLADLFAILKTTEKLERAYVRDAISAREYEPACNKLIAQFKTLYGSIKYMVPDVNQFMAQYNMQCPMAAQRLLHSGIPATYEHGKPDEEGGSQGNAVSVASTVQYFITTMDTLKLNMIAVDQVYPLLSDLVQSLHKVKQLPPDFEGKQKTKEWLSKLHAMPASQDLGEDEVRQLLFDLETAYTAFIHALPS